MREKESALHLARRYNTNHSAPLNATVTEAAKAFSIGCIMGALSRLAGPRRLVYTRRGRDEYCSAIHRPLTLRSLYYLPGRSL